MLENTLCDDEEYASEKRVFKGELEGLKPKLFLLEEEIQESPVFEYFDDVVRFISRSRGRGRKRKYPKEVILIKKSGRYHYWNGYSDKITKSLPWDKWAQEAYPDSYDLVSRIGNPSSLFREDLFNILETLEEIKEIKNRINESQSYLDES